MPAATRPRAFSRRAEPARFRSCGIRKPGHRQRNGARRVCEAQMDLLSKRSGWTFAEFDRRLMIRWLRACALSIGVAAGVAGPRPAQADAQADEYRVKAAFLYKFGSYIEWPSGSFARADSPVAIGVMGADALADELVQIVAGRNVNGRPVRVRKLRPGDPIAGLHVLFVGRDSGRLAEILAAAKGRALLTVTES